MQRSTALRYVITTLWLVAIPACGQEQPLPPQAPLPVNRVVAETRAGRELPVEDVSENDVAVLKRFVQECLEVTPGFGEFPAEFKIGQRDPNAHELAETDARLEDAFRICQYEVTQELFGVVMGLSPSRWKGLRNSVESLSFAEANIFCQRLTRLLQGLNLIGKDQLVRLPTYVEWEYCCRAGTTSRYGFGQDAGLNGGTELLDEYAWHASNSEGYDPEVGSLKPNAWGLYDCHGYLWEFIDGAVPAEIKVPPGQCVIRGGAWKDPYPLLSSSAYLTVASTATRDDIGLRCVIASRSNAKNTANR